MKNLKVGLQLYGIREDLAKDYEGSLKAVKEMGYDYVEFAGGTNGYSYEEIRALLDKYGLKCISVHQSADTWFNDPEGAVRQVKVLGADYNTICIYPYVRYVEEGIDAPVAKFARYAKAMKEAGLQGMYHNHAFEFDIMAGDKYLLDHIFDTIPDLMPELDLGWVHYGGEDPAAYVDKYAQRIHIVHLKDFSCANLPQKPIFQLVAEQGRSVIPPTRKDAGFKYLPVGSGIQDWTSIIDACRRSSAQYLVVEQDESLDCSQLEAARISREYLKNNFGI